jgi:MOSC domain-containing protein YiiM
LDTGERDVKIPYLLRKHYGHMDMGIYAEVVKGGQIHVGDEIVVE